MRLRIVAGHLGGRYIETAAGRTIRPTSERVREAWFSAIGPGVVDADVWDLFSGSGALGIEALSRGARHVHFVESDGRAVSILRGNLDALGLADSARVIRSDVFRWVGSADSVATLALADPPYAGGDASRLVSVYGSKPFAECLWVEHEAKLTGEFAERASWTRRYGDSAVSRFCRLDEHGAQGVDSA